MRGFGKGAAGRSHPIGVILGILLIALASRASGQISPGNLSRAHQDLNGPLSCGRCHKFGIGEAEFKCLDCHQEISRRLAEHRGYHARVVKPGAGNSDCVRCHSEHNGRTARLIRWPKSRQLFDHAQTGWALEGHHRQLKCAECHNVRYLTPEDRTVLKRHDLNTSFAGLDSRCVTCHKDAHEGQLDSNCLKCHDQATWKNPPLFSHQQTRYPLTGLHAGVACEKCHQRSAPGAAVKYRNFTFFENCRACHQDPHGGAFSEGCQNCHTTAGWKQLVETRRFDHSKTRFPLLGKHDAATCRACHKTENFRAPIAFARCLDCHQDPHDGQFARRADGGDCKSCHDERAFRPALFTVSQHASSDYPLLGKHAAVACDRCHLPRGKDTRYHIAFSACTDCHRDAHAGQFAGPPHQNRCDDCHTVNGFQPANFTLLSHNRTAFPLHGAHAAVPCSACHVPKGENTAFHLAAGNCESCHASPHGRFASGNASCESCHSVTSWKERATFDHDRTAFPLLGKHRAADCLACHKLGGQGTFRTILFAGTAKDCAACHADIHDGQFRASGDETGCARCHTYQNWRPTEFDHSRHSTFHLNGAHERVPCRICHDQRKVVDGRTVILYKGTPRECTQCHQ